LVKTTSNCPDARATLSGCYLVFEKILTSSTHAW
jgi:hypothetical protein